MLMLVVFRAPTGVHAKIEDLIVDVDVELADVAERLVRRALKTSTSRGVQTVQAVCPPSNKGMSSIYEQCGFERRSTTAYRFKISG